MDLGTPSRLAGALLLLVTGVLALPADDSIL